MMTFPLSRRAALEPLALMRLTEIKDVDELLKRHERDDIIVEKKFDGWRVQAIKDGGSVRLFSRRGEEKTGNFPGIVRALEPVMPDGTIVEGELVYWHEDKQDITKVQSVAGSSPEKARSKAADLPGKFKLHLYDILWLKGRNVTTLPFSERRKLLESTIKASNLVQLTQMYPFSKWQDVVNKAVAENGEGIVLKLKDKKYHWKPSGETEAKPPDVMFKYKGGGGKTDSDDYVVYDTELGSKGKFKALFGQHYKGRLYHISEISNLSGEHEKEIRKRLEKGPFVIEIGFQERVPGGLRSQRFIRFRDDKKPKDATMHEFHAKNIDKFEPVTKKAYLFAVAQERPSTAKIIEYLRSLVSRPVSRTGPVPGVDLDKAYKITSTLETGNRFLVGDSGTSFGTVQVRIDSMMNLLASDPEVERVTGLPPAVFRQVAAKWIKARQALDSIVRGGRLFKNVPVDPEAVRQAMKQRGRTLRRMEGTKVRHFPGGQPGFVRIGRDGRMTGYALNTEALESIPGFSMTPEARARIEWIMRRYVTTGVVRNSLAKLIAEQQAPRAFSAINRTLRPSKVNRTPALRSLVDRAAKRNFSNRVRAVVEAVKGAGYDTSAPGAFNIYQLVTMANTGGLGPVRRFLGVNSRNEPKFEPRPFPRGVLHALRRANPVIQKITGINSDFPSNNGMGGFSRDRSADDPQAAGRRGDLHDQAVLIGKLIGKWLNLDHVDPSEMREARVSYIAIARGTQPPSLIVWVDDRADAIQALLPAKLYGMRLDVQESPVAATHAEFDEDEPTVTDLFARMSPRLFGLFRHRLQQEHSHALERAKRGAWADLGIESEEEAAAMESQVRQQTYRRLAEESELEMRSRVLEQVARETGITEQQLANLIGMGGFRSLLSARQTPPIMRRAFLSSGTLAFPGQYAQDIRDGKREYTVRPTRMPVEADQVVMAMTYSGAPICQIRILSNERMSLGRIHKAFGGRMAGSLERRFGPGRRFTVIRFHRFDEQAADDGAGEDDSKWDEVLIDHEGTTWTRREIHNHYAKPAVRKKIMSRVRGKPVLLYIGTGRNEKILKRNHNDKPIVITADDPAGDDNPSNYWYWVKRRLLSIHEVLGGKTDHGFVDLDPHGGYPMEKMRAYAKKLSSLLARKYGSPTIYQSGGEGLHVEFPLKQEMSVDTLRKELRQLLDEFNEDFEDVTTGIVKGQGMRSDISTLHRKGGIRVPGAIGETRGKVKKPISGSGSDTDDDYGNNAFGEKHDYSGEPLESGAITPRPFITVTPGRPTVWHACLKRKELFRKAGEE